MMIFVLYFGAITDFHLNTYGDLGHITIVIICKVIDRTMMTLFCIFANWRLESQRIPIFMVKSPMVTRQFVESPIGFRHC